MDGLIWNRVTGKERGARVRQDEKGVKRNINLKVLDEERGRN
jgi:hypothetical protein